MTAKVAISRAVFPETLALLAAHFQVRDNQEDRALDGEALAQLLADRDGALLTLTDRVDDALLDRCPQLKAVCNIAVGYNNIDVPACTRRGILVTNTPGVLDESTADFAWALMLGAARRLSEAERYVRKGLWQRWELRQMLGFDVHHATLGIIGLGRIGQAVARRASGFAMRVIYHNRRPVDSGIEQQCNATYSTMEDL